jgi:hypothetical protein
MIIETTATRSSSSSTRRTATASISFQQEQHQQQQQQRHDNNQVNETPQRINRDHNRNHNHSRSNCRIRKFCCNRNNIPTILFIFIIFPLTILYSFFLGMQQANQTNLIEYQQRQRQELLTIRGVYVPPSPFIAWSMKHHQVEPPRLRSSRKQQQQQQHQQQEPILLSPQIINEEYNNKQSLQKQHNKKRRHHNFTVGICLIVKDGEAYIQEWIDYHLFVLKFDAIYISDNSKNYDLKKFHNNLAAAATSINISVVDNNNNNVFNNNYSDKVFIHHKPLHQSKQQLNAYKECIQTYGKDPAGPKHDYFALIDTGAQVNYCFSPKIKPIFSHV